jgi:hypothetical protein
MVLMMTREVFCPESTTFLPDVTSKGSHTPITEMGCEVPEGKYIVVYTLAPKRGALKSRPGVGVNAFMYAASDTKTPPDSILNCKIPHEWIGLRFNRKVVIT